ncbi:MAG TPA: hypothetical protein VN420_02515 [Candidatus Fimivivens sp.]|nr:hypothetical protein [Candidatus Fimivivens sp.]
MKNVVILDRGCFRGSAARDFRTSPAMAKLLENRKVASVLLDDRRKREFFDVMWANVGESGELDTDTLRKILGDLYADARTISKGGVQRIADALLTENRDPKYFTNQVQPETQDGSGTEKIARERDERSENDSDEHDTSGSTVVKKRLIDRVLGW